LSCGRCRRGEIDGAPDGFVDAVFSHGGEISLPACESTKRDYVARVAQRRGGADGDAGQLILTDSGLGGRLIGLSEERAKDPTALVGPLLENFAIGEVARQLSWDPPRL
jgi:hypothetical protein